MPNTALLVLGMHRSGTSALMGSLGLAGVYLGNNLTPAATDNAKGFFEHDDVWRIHDELFSALGMTSVDIRSMPTHWESYPTANAAKARLLAVLKEDMAHQPLWGIKDPRLCRFFPLWPDVLHALNARPAVIIALRHPAEVVASLMARDHLEPVHALILWLHHTLEAEQASRGLPRVVQVYPDLLTNWRTEFARLAEALNIPLACDGQPTSDIDKFLDSTLRHQVHATDWKDRADPWERMAHMVYTTLVNQAETTWAANLDPIHETLVRTEYAARTLPAPLLRLWGAPEEAPNDMRGAADYPPQIEKCQATVARLEMALTAMSMSRSWRATAPMRRVTGWVRSKWRR